MLLKIWCDHEEYDTRVFLHAQHAAQEHHIVLIKTPDTDVTVMALNLEKDLLYRLYFHTGVTNIKITDFTKMTAAVCSALIAIHTFSSCDSTSAFHGNWKRKTLSVACEEKE